MGRGRALESHPRWRARETLHEGLRIETPGAKREPPRLESDVVLRNLLAPGQRVAVPFAMPPPAGPPDSRLDSGPERWPSSCARMLNGRQLACVRRQRMGRFAPGPSPRAPAELIVGYRCPAGSGGAGSVNGGESARTSGRRVRKAQLAWGRSARPGALRPEPGRCGATSEVGWPLFRVGREPQLATPPEPSGMRRQERGCRLAE
jgi:hypothetical protein